jgi:hypothetical protein
MVPVQWSHKMFVITVQVKGMGPRGKVTRAIKKTTRAPHYIETSLGGWATFDDRESAQAWRDTLTAGKGFRFLIREIVE